MEKSYRMVKTRGEDLFTEKKSRFIGYAAPVYTEDEATEFINGIKKKHYDASHNCYAYILGSNSSIQRSSDDGEPSGTAGVPILEVLKKEGLTNTAVVVTRYFGGIMLGAGGLIRAYTEGASIAIKASGIVKVQPFSAYRLNFEYGLLNKLQYELPRSNYIIAGTEYFERVSMKILALPEACEALENDVTQWTNGNAEIEFIETSMLKIDEATDKIIDIAD
ncbi:MAG: YigZ family protein [Bacillota bacterium]